jgi:hypothetical protein
MVLLVMLVLLVLLVLLALELLMRALVPLSVQVQQVRMTMHVRAEGKK